MEGEMLIYKQCSEIDESIGYKKITLRDIDEEVVLYKIKDVESNKDSIILGYVRHNKDVSELEEDNNYLQLGEDNYYEILKKRPRFTKLLGCVKIGENTYINYAKRRLFPIFLPIIFILLIILFIIFIWFKPNKDEPKQPSKGLADTVVSDGIVTNNDLFIDNGGYITFAGYDLVYATEDEPTILLENPDTNDVYFTYEIILNETGDVLLEESDLIPPGQALPWDAYSVLDKGEHIVTFNIYSYDMTNTEIAYTPAVMDNILVKIY